MSFIEQLHMKLSKLSETYSREELEQMFDEILESVNEDNTNLRDKIFNFHIPDQQYTEIMQKAKDQMFDEVYTETRLKQIQKRVCSK